MELYEFTDDMCQISGYGGDYERACRAAVAVGATWVTLHPFAEPQIDGNNGVSGYVRGANEDGAQMLDCIDDQPFTMDDGRKVPLGDVLTPSMYYVALYHITWIAEHGWNAYAEQMRSATPLHTGALPRGPDDSRHH
jgi:hypothetical protein